jgi:hypothetical protein
MTAVNVEESHMIMQLTWQADETAYSEIFWRKICVLRHAWGGEVFTEFWWGGSKGRDHWEGVDVGGRVTLRWFFGR